ncbi:hypothetical protein OOT46_21825 [Aquabacterium sp. A7-Y]|uniref:hypothetical protein n=1 Tax=Aquabacterium sp. A7-Y TaxID=1349605 RepID=UPI00223E0023|nr:hypothetical protein [Aquabacterium sp. A7-Y]MCW7540467.1 hypothetical protein [Aquabacterium sp. A7-Y]
MNFTTVVPAQQVGAATSFTVTAYFKPLVPQVIENLGTLPFLDAQQAWIQPELNELYVTGSARVVLEPASVLLLLLLGLPLMGRRWTRPQASAATALPAK